MSCVQTRINYSNGMFCFSFQGTTPQFTRSYADKKWLRNIILSHLFECSTKQLRISLGFKRQRPAKEVDRQAAMRTSWTVGRKN